MSRRRSSFLVAGLVLSALALLTARRVPVWHSDASLWASSEQTVRALINQGVDAQQHGDVAAAYHFYNQAALHAQPDPAIHRGPDTLGESIAWMDIATLDASAGRWDDAAQHVALAHRLDASVHQALLERDLAREPR